MSKAQAKTQRAKLVLLPFRLISLLLLTCTATAIPRLNRVTAQAPAGKIIIAEYLTDVQNPDSDNLFSVKSTVYTNKSGKTTPIMSCYTHSRLSSLNNITISNNSITINSICEELAVSTDGGASWKYWNRQRSVYKDGFIERVDIKANLINLKYYRAGPPIHFDYWLSLDGGEIWKMVGSK